MPDGSTPVHLAAMRGYLEIVRYCHSNGADLNVGDAGGFTPALEAAAYGQVDALKLLKQLGADLRRKSVRLSFTVAHEAVTNNFPQVLQLCIEYGLPLNEKDSKGRTPLDIAIFNGKGNNEWDDCIKILTENLSSTVPLINKTS